MNINWLESILFGLVSGFAEFLPVSSNAHKTIFLFLFGVDSEHAFLSLFVHIGVLLGLVLSSRTLLKHLYREMHLKKIPKRRRRRQPDLLAMADLSLIKTAAVPMLIGFVIYFFVSQWYGRLEWIALFLLLNGIVLHIPAHLPKGNKDSRSMSALDGTLIGFSAVMSMLPGVSRVGIISSVSLARGADMQQAYKWSLLLSLPAIAAWIGLDFYSIITVGLTGVDFTFVVKCLLSGAAACFGACAAMTSMKFLAVRTGFSNFSYYSWGAALFAFILYLT